MPSVGLEVLFSSVQRDLRTPTDCLVCGIHWVLITNDLRCIGKGEESSGGTERKSELLPPGWNENHDVYILRYSQGSENYLLKVVKADSAVMAHLMRVCDERITSVNINLSDFTSEDFSSYERAFSNVEGLERVLQSELLSGFTVKNSSGPSHSQINGQQQQSNPLRDDRPGPDHDPLRIPPRRGNYHPPPGWSDPDNPFSIGRGDLDPFHRGGGMFMDPFAGRGRLPPGFNPSSGLPGRLPRGAVPPGARFDPFGPPGGPPGQRPGPDPDHARPPDYDDMFM